jgi:chaperone required for assembly of F1-ATPase
MTVYGVMHQRQPPDSLAALRAAVAAEEAFGLVALHDLATLSGSLVLGLAVVRRALDPGEAWELSRIDETWQAEKWGSDDEAEAAALARRADFLHAAAFSSMLSRAAHT